MIKDYQIKILMLLHDGEEFLGEIYKIFSEKYPEHNNLWQTLIKEKLKQAEAVRMLYKEIYEGHVIFDEGRVKPYAVKSVIEYLQGVHDNAKRGKYTARQALAVTYDMERSLIEKDVFKHFKADSIQLINVLNALHKGTLWHIDIAKKELDTIQG